MNGMVVDVELMTFGSPCCPWLFMVRFQNIAPDFKAMKVVKVW
jgi:hypothetical protein